MTPPHTNIIRLFEPSVSLWNSHYTALYRSSTPQPRIILIDSLSPKDGRNICHEAHHSLGNKYFLNLTNLNSKQPTTPVTMDYLLTDITRLSSITFYYNLQTLMNCEHYQTVLQNIIYSQYFNCLVLQSHSGQQTTSASLSHNHL